MTCIVSHKVFTSKAALKTAAEQGRLWIEDPSLFSTRGTFNAKEMAVGQSEVVTNHPKRTKFAKITRTAGGWRVE